MSSQLERSPSRRWIPLFATLAIMGLLVALIVTVDGRIAAWSQHLAQNAADAAALAGTRTLHEIMHSAAFACDETPESLILQQIQLYADLNHTADTGSRLNTQGYYLTQTAAGTYQVLLNPETGQPWQVGATGSIPCAALQGLHVEVYYPQETLFTRLFAIEHARVVVEAAASQQGAPWAIMLVTHSPAAAQRAAALQSINIFARAKARVNAKIKVYLTDYAIIRETLPGKQAVPSAINSLALPWPAARLTAGTKVGLSNKPGHVIQSISEESGIGS